MLVLDGGYGGLREDIMHQALLCDLKNKTEIFLVQKNRRRRQLKMVHLEVYVLA